MGDQSRRGGLPDRRIPDCRSGFGTPVEGSSRGPE